MPLIRTESGLLPDWTGERGRHAERGHEHDEPPGPGALAGPPLPSLSLSEAAAQIARLDRAWEGETLTFAFAASRDDYDDYPLRAEELPGFTPLPEAYQDALRAVIALWDDVIAIDFVEIEDAAQADIRLGGSTSMPQGVSGWGYFPPPAGAPAEGDDGDVWINLSGIDLENPDPYFDWALFLHEFGHAIGLAHPSDFGGRGYAENSFQYTVMSRYSETETGADFVNEAADRVLPAFARGGTEMTPMLHDIAAAQLIYGADGDTRPGDDVYGFNASEAGGFFDFSVWPNPRLSIWDAGGTDTLDFSGYAAPTVLDLRPGAFSSTPNMALNLSIAAGTTIENAVGGAGDDVIFGNDADNVIAGGPGDDRLYGFDGADTLSFAASAAGVVVDLARGVARGAETGADSLSGFERVLGGAGRDIVRGAGGDNRLDGGAGDDVLRGRGGDDRLEAVSGDNILDGGAGDDSILGGSGDDLLLGRDGADALTGGAGADNLKGMAGDDVIIGGAGRDFLNGGEGADLFVFESIGDSTPDPDGRDTILGFARGGGDLIDLSAIDANVDTQRDDAFVIVDEFTGTQGELRYELTQTEITWRIQADVDGDGEADFELLVRANTMADDAFIL